MRGAPTVYYGDEVGMIGSGGDKAAREDMFPTQVPEWQTEPRVGSPPIGKGSSFDVTDNPIETELRQLAALRESHSQLSLGWSIVRYAKGAVVAVARVDPATKRELVVVLNNGSASTSVTFATSTPSARWSQLRGTPVPFAPPTSAANGNLTVPVSGTTAVVLEAETPIAAAAPPKPKLRVKADDLTNLWSASAAVGGTAPVSVAFVVQRATGAWQRLDVDTSPPFRGFIDPAKFKRNERIKVVAIARSLDGRTAISAVLPSRVRRR